MLSGTNGQFSKCFVFPVCEYLFISKHRRIKINVVKPVNCSGIILVDIWRAVEQLRLPKMHQQFIVFVCLFVLGLYIVYNMSDNIMRGTNFSQVKHFK